MNVDQRTIVKLYDALEMANAELERLRPMQDIHDCLADPTGDERDQEDEDARRTRVRIQRVLDSDIGGHVRRIREMMASEPKGEPAGVLERMAKATYYGEPGKVIMTHWDELSADRKVARMDALKEGLKTIGNPGAVAIQAGIEALKERDVIDPTPGDVEACVSAVMGTLAR